MSSEDLANLVKQRYREMVDSGADPQQWSLPALMPTLQERQATGRLDPKSFETGSHINQPKKEI
ncbi:MAG: hypothetical protein V3U25_03190 [Nitrososphaerales archaeon]